MGVIRREGMTASVRRGKRRVQSIGVRGVVGKETNELYGCHLLFIRVLDSAFREEEKVMFSIIDKIQGWSMKVFTI
jgi:hypothetical protein